MTRGVALVSPPQAKPCEPTPGLLALAGHLRARGLPCALVDGNLEVQEVLLSAASLGRCAQDLRAAGASPARITSAERSARAVGEAVAALRRRETYGSYPRYRAAVDALAEGYRTLSRARGARIGLADLEEPGLSPLRGSDLREAHRSALAPEVEALARRVLATDPVLVGVSATYLSQAVPAFALASALRREGYRGLLVLGGGVVTSWASRLRPESPVFEGWDALIVGPGEEALARFAARGGVEPVPGVLAPRNGIWDRMGSGARPPVCFEPDGTGLPWHRYLAPGPVFPLSATRGCYWRRCRFCPEAAQDRQPFRSARAEALAAAMTRAAQAAGASWFHLTDDAVPPALLRGLARRLSGSGLRWYGFARLEPQLEDPSFARELADGGCAMLQLGVETASQALLDRLGKGVPAGRAGRAVRNLAAAGIRTFVYLLFGVPGETDGEVTRTLRWAEEHASSITFLNLALMNLPRGSDVEGGAPSMEAAEETGADLSLYHAGAAVGLPDRRALRRRLEEARSDEWLRSTLARTPPGFTSNHAAFAPLPPPGAAGAGARS